MSTASTKIAKGTVNVDFALNPASNIRHAARHANEQALTYANQRSYLHIDARDGDPGGTRTPYLQIRNLSLYPDELRDHKLFMPHFIK